MNASVLIVEDDESIAQVVKSYLLEAGFFVFVADCGAEALRLAKQEHPDLVLLDLKLPDLPGEAVCRGIKELEDIPVIMVTSKASEEERITGFALGADDYVVKPFSARELVFRVKAVLKRSESKVESSPQASFNSGKLVLETDDYRVTVNNSPAMLTATEFKLLHLMATLPGKVFTREELVDKALGYAGTTTQTIKAPCHEKALGIGSNIMYGSCRPDGCPRFRRGDPFPNPIRRLSP